MEDELKAQGDRIKLLEGTLGAAASDKCNVKCPPWSWVDGLVAEFPRSVDGMGCWPAEAHDASSDQIPLSKINVSPAKNEASLLLSETCDASPRKPPHPTPRSDAKPVKKAIRTKNKKNKEKQGLPQLVDDPTVNASPEEVEEVPPSPTQTTDITPAKKLTSLAAEACPPFPTPRTGSK